MKKAFDTMNHAMLLGKLRLYGVDCLSFKWFRHYLSDRKQQTLMLFSIYMIDLPSCYLLSKPKIYATSRTSSAEDSYILKHKMNYDMNLIQSWLTANKLILNIKRTKKMLIGSKFKLSQIHNNFTVKVLSAPLDRVAQHKVLGIHIHESLNWRPHINATSKLSKILVSS